MWSDSEHIVEHLSPLLTKVQDLSPLNGALGKICLHAAPKIKKDMVKDAIANSIKMGVFLSYHCQNFFLKRVTICECLLTILELY